MLSVSDVMSRNVVAIHEDATLHEAAKLMTAERVGSLIVLRNNMPIGIITETDMTKFLASNKDASTRVIEEMSSPLHSFRLDADVMEIANAMRSNRIKKIPIIEGHRVLGIVTQTDIIKHVIRSISTLCSNYGSGSLDCKEFADKSTTLFSGMYDDGADAQLREWYMRCRQCNHYFLNPETDDGLKIKTCPNCDSHMLEYDRSADRL